MQITFAQDVKLLKRAIEEMGNPFGETSVNLLVLNSRNSIIYANERLINQTMLLQILLSVATPVSLVGLQLKKYHRKNSS